MRERNAELTPERKCLVQALNPGDEAIILDLNFPHVNSSRASRIDDRTPISMPATRLSLGS